MVFIWVVVASVPSYLQFVQTVFVVSSKVPLWLLGGLWLFARLNPNYTKKIGYDKQKKIARHTTEKKKRFTTLYQPFIIL